MHDFYIVICVWLTKLMSTNQFSSQKTFFNYLMVILLKSIARSSTFKENYDE